MTDQTPSPFGDLDGEPVEAVTIKLTGGARFPRRLEENEQIVLVVTGATKAGITIKRIDGQLTRIHTIAASQIAEPTDQLAEEAESFLKALAAADDNQAALPLDEGWEYDQPDPQPSEEEE